MAARLAILVTTVFAIGGSVMAGSTCPCTQGCCAQGWIQYKDACYLPELQHKKSWRQAEEYCVEQESHLASVHSHEEDNFILHLMGNVKLRSYWLGAEKIRQVALPGTAKGALIHLCLSANTFWRKQISEYVRNFWSFKTYCLLA